MNNKLTLVSGAGRGIGEAIAKKFYKEGHNLILLIHEFKHKKKIEKVFDKNRVTYLIGDLKSKKFIQSVDKKIKYVDNLINNAFFYAKGKVILIATLEEESFTISVIDDGPGIPDKELERLLKPFERLDEARGNEGGCGLGLSIADRIAKAHDGRLELISNKKDKGLEAKITIPIIRA